MFGIKKPLWNVNLSGYNAKSCDPTSKLSRTQKPFTPPIVAHDPVDSKKTASDSIHAFFVQYFLMEEIRLTSQYGKYPIIHLQGFIHPRWLLLRISHVSYDFIHPRMWSPDFFSPSTVVRLQKSWRPTVFRMIFWWMILLMEEFLHQLYMVNIPLFTRFYTSQVVVWDFCPSTVVTHQPDMSGSPRACPRRIFWDFDPLTILVPLWWNPDGCFLKWWYVPSNLHTPSADHF